MDDVAKWSQKDRDDLFSETSASKNGLNITIIEKDFWVCWVLKRVFSSPTKELPLIFKGGTSLSKAYSAIERFSEDIDLSINRTFFDFQGDKDPTNIDLSRNKRKKLLDEMAEKLANYLEFKLLPELQTIFTSELGEGGWRLEISKDNKENMLFYYPTTNGPAETDEYIKSVILLEFGTRSDHWPSEMASITSYAAEEFSSHFNNPSTNVNVLKGERTFWEKATILHAEFHRTPPKTNANRLQERLDSCGQTALEEQAQDLWARADQLTTQILETPSKTMKGVAVKLRRAEEFGWDELSISFATAALADIERLTA